MPKRKYEEYTEQEYLIEWFAAQYPTISHLLVHVPNGSNVGVRAGARLKKMGLRKGFPDLFLFIPGGGWHGLAIEMKKKKGGRVTPEQQFMLEKLEKSGYKAIVAHGFDEASQAIKAYITESFFV